MVAAGHVDLHEVLIYYPSCTEVEVSHFGVAHLSVRKADILSAGLKVAERIFFPEGLDVGSPLRVDGVCPVMLALAPAVEDHQKYFSVHNINEI